MCKDLALTGYFRGFFLIKKTSFSVKVIVMKPSEKRQESNVDELLEECEMRWQSLQTPKLHSCFIQAGYAENRGALCH